MRYRNLITGAEFETMSVCSAPNWELVGAEIPKKSEPAKASEEIIEEKPKKTAVSKSAKKPSKRSTRK